MDAEPFRIDIKMPVVCRALRSRVPRPAPIDVEVVLEGTTSDEIIGVELLLVRLLHLRVDRLNLVAEEQ